MIENLEKFVHSYNLNNIKKEIRNCTYIAHEESKKVLEDGSVDKAYCVVAKVKNTLGGVDRIVFPLECAPKEMGQKEYDFILDNLKNRDY